MKLLRYTWIELIVLEELLNIQAEYNKYKADYITAGGIKIMHRTVKKK